MNKHSKDIFDFWEKEGLSKPPGDLVTHKDRNQVSLEINTITKLLNGSDAALDVGCGNGFATSVYAKKCSRVVGIDYSDNMVNAASKAYKMKNLDFKPGNVLSLGSEIGKFSAVLSTRCLINLTSWDEQKRSIVNLHRILSKGGRLILTEGIKQGRDNLNKLRNKMGLSSMPKVWHNLDFDELKLLPFLKKFFVIKKDVRFGLYDVLTRVIYPAAIYPREPKHGTDFHSIAERIYYLAEKDVWREYGREACLVLVKR